LTRSFELVPWLMSDSVEVTVYIDRELDFKVVKSLKVDSSVADLKECLAGDDPTGETHAQDIRLRDAGDGRLVDDPHLITRDRKEFEICSPDELDALEHGCSVEPLTAITEACDHVDGLPDPAPEPCEFRVMQGPLFKKPGFDPTGNKVIQLKRNIASVVKTTGKTWRGAAGGEWVEVDSAAEKPGWLLVEGPGFDIHGPLLEKIDVDDEQPIVLGLVSAASHKSYGEICVKPSQSITLAQSWINLRTGGHRRPDRIWCMKATLEDTYGGKFIRGFRPSLAQDTFDSLKFQDGDTVAFIITNPDSSFADD